ncbi:hypothetical protein [Actinomycetospora atypica]|uniref:Uncharacterized protein n=1 Tax=Actinomycetospora atypica TaxID=1290095 RepID=A0ABV9YK01_9PSEU
MITTAVAAIAAGTAAWAAAPFVAMARRGTLDDQGRAVVREEAARLETLRRARRREALVAAAAAVTVPEQRRRSLLPA